MQSADLGGRVGWLPKAERVKTLFLSPLQPQNAGGWGGGGVGGYPGFVSLQVPTSEAAVSADTHAFATLPPGGLQKNRNLGKRPKAPGGPGPKPWGPGPQAPWRPGPQAPGAWIGSRHSHRSSCSSKIMGRVSKRYITPNPRPWGALDGFRRRSCTVP